MSVTVLPLKWGVAYVGPHVTSESENDCYKMAQGVFLPHLSSDAYPFTVHRQSQIWATPTCGHEVARATISPGSFAASECRECGCQFYSLSLKLEDYVQLVPYLTFVDDISDLPSHLRMLQSLEPFSQR